MISQIRHNSARAFFMTRYSNNRSAQISGCIADRCPSYVAYPHPSKGAVRSNI